MIQKNEKYIITISDLGTEGEGIGKIDGFTVFVPYALPGEECEVLIVKVNKNFAYGKLIDIIKASKNRIEPKCSVFKKCGGCSLMHMDYEAEKEFKTKRVSDCIKRIGKCETEVLNVLGSDLVENYRNKALFPITENGIGFYAQRSHRVVEFDKCLIQNNISNLIKTEFYKFAKENELSFYNEETNKGDFRGLYVRSCEKTKEIMVCIITRTKKFPKKEEIISLFKDLGATSIVQNINPQKTNVALGEEEIILYGNGYIKASIGNLFFNISPKAFLQINEKQTEKLYNKVKEFADLKGNETVLDLFCGAGTIGLYVSDKAKKVTGVEIVPEAVFNAKENAMLNNIKNAEFICKKAEEISTIKADIVIVDPPRKGCDEKLINTLGEIAPKKLIYVSCNPATLARDILLLKDKGYTPKIIQPVDMFPRTSHVETVVLLNK